MSQEQKEQGSQKLKVVSVLATVLAIIAISWARGSGAQVLDVLKSVGLLLAGLSILVVIHEFGHYAAAKAFGMKVERFYLFFDAWDIKLFSFKRGETEYGIGWLPLGGYVKIAGMIDENMDTDFLQSEPKPWEYRSKPVWQRIIVMIGGVVMNVLLGIFILSMMKFAYGDERIPLANLKQGIEVRDSVWVNFKDGTKKKIPTVGHVIGLRTGDNILSFSGEKYSYVEDYAKPNLLLKSGGYFEVNRNGSSIKLPIPDNAMNSVQEDEATPDIFTVNTLPQILTDSVSPCYKAGMRTGDYIQSIDGKPIQTFADITSIIDKKKSLDSIVVGYTRKTGELVSVAFRLDSLGKMGIGKDTALTNTLISHIDYGFFQAFVPGTALAFSVVRDNVAGLGKVFSGKLNARKSMSGVVGMGQIYGKATKGLGLTKGFLFITGLISMMLAFANIFPLPLPVLDGGHVVFLLFEWITGKPVPLKVFFIAQNIGIVLVLGLMVLTNLNDILRIFGI